MSIKTPKFGWIIGLALLSLNLGCAREDEPYHEIPVIDLKSASCLSDVSDKLDRYFSGESNKKEIEGLWKCTDTAINTFVNYVKGSVDEGYLATDLRAFLESYFLNDAKKGAKRHRISDGLLEEAMELKRLFLGGSRTTLSADEMRQTLYLISQFRQMTLELLPYTPLFFGEVKGEVSVKTLDEAMIKLEDVLVRFFHLIERQGLSYDFARLQRLIDELAAYFEVDTPDSRFRDFARIVPIAAEAKGLLLNSTRERIAESEWREAARAVTDLLRVYFRARLSLKQVSLTTPEGLHSIQKTVEDSLYGIRRALARRQMAPIANSEVIAVVSELGKLDMLPLGFDAEQASRFYTRAMDFILNPQNSFPRSGLGDEKLGYLEGKFLNWIKVQEVLLGKRDSETAPDWPEMQGVLNSPWPLATDRADRLIIDGKKEAVVGIEASSRLNWARAAFKALFDAYVQDPQRRANMQMSKDELRQAYLDLKPIFVGLGLIEREDVDFNERLFRDANLFMFRSNGDRFLDFYETVEYLHYVFSGIAGGEYFMNLVPRGCLATENDVAVGCFRDLFRSAAGNSLKHLPLYLKYSKNLSKDRWEKDIRNIEKTNRREKDAPTPINRSDIFETFVMLQYIETLMLRFDVDQSGELELKEALAAFEHFKYVIGDILGLDGDRDHDELEALFTYIMRYEEFPSQDDPITMLRFLNWKWDRAQWSLSIDRGVILKILAVISSQ